MRYENYCIMPTTKLLLSVSKYEYGGYPNHFRQGSTLGPAVAKNLIIEALYRTLVGSLVRTVLRCGSYGVEHLEDYIRC